MIKVGNIISEKDEIGVVDPFVDLWNSGWTRLAALRLEELNDGERFDIMKTGGGMDVRWVVERDGTGEWDVLLAKEEFLDGRHRERDLEM